MGRRFALAPLAAAAIAGGLIAAVVPTSAAASSYSNPTPITIPSSGTASPYPSAINISGLPGAVTRVRATLHAVSHAFPEDIEALLVAPNGQRTVLMGFVCGDGDPGEEATGQTFNFADGAPSLPFFAFCPSGTYRPSRNPAFSPPSLPAPAPTGPQTTAAMSALIGSPADGAWRLFVFDPADPDGGSIGGWSLELLTDARCSKKAATLIGTAGPDVLTGTLGPDVILGLGGKDTIKGLAGKDVICGGTGKDRLVGNNGEDKLLGGRGKDELKGGKGKDRLLGQGGKDELRGGKGKDVCKGGKKNDSAKGCEIEKSI